MISSSTTFRFSIRANQGKRLSGSKIPDSSTMLIDAEPRLRKLEDDASSAEPRLRKLEADASSARDQIRKLEANASSTAAEIESMKRNLDLINFQDTHSALTRRLQWNQGDYRFCDMGQAKATPEIHASYTRESNYLAHQAPTLAFTYQGMKSIHAVMLNANKIADDWTSFVKKLLAYQPDRGKFASAGLVKSLVLQVLTT